MGGTWRSEDFAGKAIFQLDCLTVDDDLLGPGRGPVARAAIGHVCGKTMERNQYSNKKMLRWKKTTQTNFKNSSSDPKIQGGNIGKQLIEKDSQAVSISQCSASFFHL